MTGSQAAGKQARKGPPIRGKVLIMVDVFMNYNEPEVGRAMVHVLEHLGYEVLVTQPLASGRTQLSKGFVRDARGIAHKNIGLLTPYASGKESRLSARSPRKSSPFAMNIWIYAMTTGWMVPGK